MLKCHIDIHILLQFGIGEIEDEFEVLQCQFTLMHLAVDVRERQMNFFILRFERQEVFYTRGWPERAFRCWQGFVLLAAATTSFGQSPPA